MEIFTIDGRRSFELKKNKELLAGLEEEGNVVKEKVKQSSAFRLRKKSLTTIVYLNLMNRRRMLKLITESRGSN